MPRKVNNYTTPCVFCNSVSHTTQRCNSNMKGRRKILTDIGETFMLNDALPDFKSFPINELRFIASIYENFQKTLNKQYIRKRMYGYFDREYDIDYLYSHIPLTLTKNRIINDMTHRWTIYANVRFNHNHKKPEDEDCPICMDCMSNYRWNPYKLKWNMIASKTQLPHAMFDGNIITSCGHTFCGDCWEMHLKANGKVEYHNDRFREELTGRIMVCCPMCRNRMYM